MLSTSSDEINVIQTYFERSDVARQPEQENI